MAVLLATGTTAAQSATFTLNMGDTTSLCLTATGNLVSGASVQLEFLATNGYYYPVGILNMAAPFLMLSSPGTFRANRLTAGYDCGVDRV